MSVVSPRGPAAFPFGIFDPILIKSSMCISTSLSVDILFFFLGLYSSAKDENHSKIREREVR